MYIVVGGVLAVVCLSILAGIIVNKATEVSDIAIDNSAKIAEADSLANSASGDYIDCDCLVCIERQNIRGSLGMKMFENNAEKLLK